MGSRIEGCLPAEDPEFLGFNRGATLERSFYNSYGKKALQWHSPMRMLFYTHAATCLLMVPVVLIEGRGAFARVAQFTAQTWVGMILSTVFHDYLSMILFLKALK